MASPPGVTGQKLARVKEEDWECGSAVLVPEGVCVKSNVWEGRIVYFKQEDCKEQLVSIKAEDSEVVLSCLEIPNLEGVELAKDHLCTPDRFPKETGRDQQADSGFPSSAITETSLQRRPPHKDPSDDTKTSNSGSRSSMELSIPPVGELAEMVTINTPEAYSASPEALSLSKECSKRFQQQPGSKYHPWVPESQKPYCCSECGKQFLRRGGLQVHSRIHTGQKPYCCSECGKHFSSSGTFLVHKRIHTGERPYGCPECDKRFSCSGGLKKHISIHTGEKPYCCSECGKRFSRMSILQSHRGIHTGEKPFGCSECGKKFAFSSNLLAHKRIHTGEKPYCCTECGKCFSYQSSLRNHKIVHTGERPYRCSECGKQFSCGGNLKKHKRLHTLKASAIQQELTAKE